MFVLANAGLIIGAVIVVILLAVGGYYFSRMMKGKLVLTLSKTGLGSGETLSGTVTITTKKSLDVRRFYVALIGHEEVEHRRGGDDDNNHTERNEIYRDEFNLESGQLLPAGFNKTYEFGLVAPGKDTVGGPGSGGGNFELNIGPVSIGGGHRKLKWKVEARVDLPGVDLATSKSVRVNLS